MMDSSQSRGRHFLSTGTYFSRRIVRSMDVYQIIHRTMSVLNCIVIYLSQLLRPPPPPERTTLLSLPTELVHAIVCKLPLAERVMLSKTCRALRYLLRAECTIAIRAITYRERIAFLAGVSACVSNRYLCPLCYETHVVNTRDTPASFRWSPCQQNTVLPPRRPDISRPKLGAYHLGQHHVQLALKLHRNRDPKYAKYLDKLLAPYFVPHLISPRDTSYMAQPAIIDGRYILFRS